MYLKLNVLPKLTVFKWSRLPPNNILHLCFNWQVHRSISIAFWLVNIALRNKKKMHRYLLITEIVAWNKQPVGNKYNCPSKLTSLRLYVLLHNVFDLHTKHNSFLTYTSSIPTSLATKSIITIYHSLCGLNGSNQIFMCFWSLFVFVWDVIKRKVRQITNMMATKHYSLEQKLLLPF